MYGMGGSPTGVSAISPNALNLCSDFLNSVNFEALLLLYASRWRHSLLSVMEILSLKIIFQKCMTPGGSPKGGRQMPNLMCFGDIFSCIPIFRPSSFPLLPSPTSPLSRFSPPLPFPKEVNKKLSYRGQNALSVIKKTRTQ